MSCIIDGNDNIIDYTSDFRKIYERISGNSIERKKLKLKDIIEDKKIRKAIQNCKCLYIKYDKLYIFIESMANHKVIRIMNTLNHHIEVVRHDIKNSISTIYMNTQLMLMDTKEGTELHNGLLDNIIGINKLIKFVDDNITTEKLQFKKYN